MRFAHTKTQLLRMAVSAFLGGLTLVATGNALAQTYPSKVVRIISSEPGGSYDFGARLMAAELSSAFSQQFIVENRGGMLGVLGSKAAPDGYTLIVSGTNLWLQPFFQETQYDPIKDFAPISLINEAPNVLVVQPSLPVKTVADLVALARAKPGEINYGTGNAGSVVQIAAEVFSSMAKVNMVRIAYKGGGPALTGLMGGQVHLIFATGGSVASLMESGKLKALAVTSREPSPLFPGLPTVSQTLPGFEVIGVVAMLAPAKTPAPIVDRLSQEVNKILLKPEIKERFFKSGVVAHGNTPEQFAAFIKADMAQTAKLVQKDGVSHQ